MNYKLDVKKDSYEVYVNEVYRLIFYDDFQLPNELTEVATMPGEGIEKKPLHQQDYRYD